MALTIVSLCLLAVAVALLIRTLVARPTAPGFIGGLTIDASPVRLREVVGADRDFLLELAADPTAAEASGWSGREVAATIRRFDHQPTFERHRRRELMAVDANTHQRVGTVVVMPSPLGPRGARSVGVQVHPSCRRHGYGRAMMAAAIADLTQSPEPVHVGTAVSNTGMQQIMADLGYTPRAGTRPHRAPNGSTIESIWYDCTRAQ